MVIEGSHAGLRGRCARTSLERSLSGFAVDFEDNLADLGGSKSNLQLAR